MATIFDRLKNEVLLKLKECKRKKTCEGLTFRTFYFEPNKYTIKMWQKEGLYKKGIDRRALFVCESPGPNSAVEEEDITVKRVWGKENTNPDAIWRLERFRKLRESYGLENCFMTNVVKCGPKKGKNHTHEETKNCSEFLDKEIKIIKPEIIIAVGREAGKILSKHHMKLINSQGCKLVEVMHYSARRNPQQDWDEKYKQVKKIVSPSPKYIPIM